MGRSWWHQWRYQTAVLVVAVGTAALRPIKGYNGCFDRDGAIIRQFDKNGRPLPDLEDHVDAGKPVFSQQRNELKNPLSYHTSKYGRYPKYLFHWTKKKDARNMAKVRHILASKKSDGDAFLGEGVYMTAIPGWANQDVVRKNNYGGAMWNKFNRWNSANAYVRVDYAALFEILEMKPKADWQSNFCIRVPMGRLLLTPRIGARISWTPSWDRTKREWRECEEWDWPPPGDWRWEYM